MAYIKTSKRQYCGLLRYRNTREVKCSVSHFQPPTLTFQLVKNYSLLWYKEDLYGGWKRLQIKFELYNLFFDGGKVPLSPTALTDTIKDLVETARSQGAEITTIPTHPISFSTLVGDLESLGLLSNTESAPTPTQPEADDALAKAHKAKVGSLKLCKTNYFLTNSIFRSRNI